MSEPDYKIIQHSMVPVFICFVQVSFQFIHQQEEIDEQNKRQFMMVCNS